MFIPSISQAAKSLYHAASKPAVITTVAITALGAAGVWVVVRHRKVDTDSTSESEGYKRLDWTVKRRVLKGWEDNYDLPDVRLYDPADWPALRGELGDEELAPRARALIHAIRKGEPFDASSWERGRHLWLPVVQAIFSFDSLWAQIHEVSLPGLEELLEEFPEGEVRNKVEQFKGELEAIKDPIDLAGKIEGLHERAAKLYAEVEQHNDEELALWVIESPEERDQTFLRDPHGALPILRHLAEVGCSPDGIKQCARDACNLWGDPVEGAILEVRLWDQQPKRVIDWRRLGKDELGPFRNPYKGVQVIGLSDEQGEWLDIAQWDGGFSARMEQQPLSRAGQKLIWQLRRLEGGHRSELELGEWAKEVRSSDKIQKIALPYITLAQMHHHFEELAVKIRATLPDLTALAESLPKFKGDIERFRSHIRPMGQEGVSIADFLGRFKFRMRRDDGIFETSIFAVGHDLVMKIRGEGSDEEKRVLDEWLEGHNSVNLLPECTVCNKLYQNMSMEQLQGQLLLSQNIWRQAQIEVRVWDAIAYSR